MDIDSLLCDVAMNQPLIEFKSVNQVNSSGEYVNDLITIPTSKEGDINILINTSNEFDDGLFTLSLEGRTDGFYDQEKDYLLMELYSKILNFAILKLSNEIQLNSDRKVSIITRKSMNTDSSLDEYFEIEIGYNSFNSSDNKSKVDEISYFVRELENFFETQFFNLFNDSEIVFMNKLMPNDFVEVISIKTLHNLPICSNINMTNTKAVRGGIVYSSKKLDNVDFTPGTRCIIKIVADETSSKCIHRIEKLMQYYRLCHRLKISIHLENLITRKVINIDRGNTLDFPNHQKYRSYLQRNILSLFGINYKVKKNDESDPNYLSSNNLTVDVKFITYNTAFLNNHISAALGVYSLKSNIENISITPINSLSNRNSTVCSQSASTDPNKDPVYRKCYLKCFIFINGILSNDIMNKSDINNIENSDNIENKLKILLEDCEIIPKGTCFKLDITSEPFGWIIESIKADSLPDEIVWIAEIDCDKSEISTKCDSNGNSDGNSNFAMRDCIRNIAKQYKQKYGLNPEDIKRKSLQKIEVPLIANLLASIERVFVERASSAQQESKLCKALKELRSQYETPSELNAALTNFLLK